MWCTVGPVVYSGSSHVVYSGSSGVQWVLWCTVGPVVYVHTVAVCAVGLCVL